MDRIGSEWDKACVIATRSLSKTPPGMPCVVFWADQGNDGSIVSLDGKRILQHLPARINLDAVDGPTYALALALFLDQTLDHNSMGKICLMIDARPGKGWANLPILKLVPFIEHTAKLLNDLHPERLDKCVLFPVPFWAKGIWTMVKPFLDPGTARRICLISGPAQVRSLFWPKKLFVTP